MKPFIIFIATVFLFQIANSQQLFKVYINNIKRATFKADESKAIEAEVMLKKYNKTKTLVIQVGDINNHGPFKQTLQLSNGADSVLISVSENASHPGKFNFDISKLRRVAYRYKVQKLYYLQDPANPMMRMPSRRTLIANIHFD